MSAARQAELPELWQGTLRKMRVEEAEPVAYRLVDARPVGSQRSEDLALNDRIGTTIHLRFTGRISCVLCGAAIKKSYGQGYCYPCWRDRPEADICILKPELCHYHEADNPCRDETFARSQCFQPHILYASLTSGCKVGITRKINLPSRWIDQGAVQAIPLAELPSRREVGLVEHRLAQRYRDRTHWMTMLKLADPPGDLPEFAGSILDELNAWGVAGILPHDGRVPRRFHYPVREYPLKVKSHNLDKNPLLEGTLLGIKGQYLILDSAVINLRKFTGYEVALSA